MNAHSATRAKTTASGPDRFITEAAPGVEAIDVTAVSAKEQRSFYADRQKIYPKLAHGRYRWIKFAVMAVTLSIYYILPWLRWDRGPGLPNQAFLLDFANQRMLFGPIELWAQELYVITGILIIAALGLFMVTALAGRMWCGYACPQTVWTDLMVLVERFWQGDRSERIRLDKGPWTFEWFWKKTATHISWLLIGLLTGGALVFYFRDAPTLLAELIRGDAPAIAYAFLGIFAFSTYLLGGIAREQVCIYMCPWPRIQGAMLDADSLLVSYNTVRGEPRGGHKKGQSWDGRGDCIDCKACVAVCPMGIDIRDGAQLECIQCALCIDACDDIMKRVGRPKSLIAYDSERNLEARLAGTSAPFRFVRPRILIYAVLISLITAALGYVLLTRSEFELNVQADRNPLFVQLSDGGLRNGYTLKVLNKTLVPRSFSLSTEGLKGAGFDLSGLENGTSTFEVAPDNVRALKAFVTIQADGKSALTGTTTPFDIVLTDRESGAKVRRHVTFRGPQ
ncbi:MAG: cytochrome c oxidase accessory protein CcoG [Hyphomicrobium sp.]